MSFRSAGFRPAVLGSALALALALSAGIAMAQDAQPETAAPAAAATAATPATAAAPAVEAALKPGDATAGQAKDRKSTRLNSSHYCASRMPSPACKQK